MIRPLRTDADYRAALRRVDELMDTAAPDTPACDELDVLATLVERYEAEHFPMDLPDAVAAIRFRMEQGGLEPDDVEACLGGAATDVLAGLRPLTPAMMLALHERLGIPLEALVRQRVAEPA